MKKYLKFYVKVFFCYLVVVCWVVLACCLSGCNVTRTMTTESKYFHKGDTVVNITTKTVETYDASKKF